MAASAGNHALGVAYHGGLLGIPVTVVMPRFAALIKVSNCRALGATVVLHGADVGEARAKAEELARAQGLTFLHPFDDLDVMAGPGHHRAGDPASRRRTSRRSSTPVGGGGLIAGIATATKALRPDVQVIGVESDSAPCLERRARGRHAGRHRRSSRRSPTASRCRASASIRSRRCSGRVDRVVTVDEASIALAILRLIELEKSVVEGAGATPLAAFLAGKLPELQGKRVVLVLCGGNIDLTMLDRVIEVGLVADGRLARFTVSITDRPGGLARLADVIASTGASIKEIVHDRAFSGPDLSEVRVVCVVETTGRTHIEALHRALCRCRRESGGVVTCRGGDADDPTL